MATGITKREKLSDDSLTAVMPHRDPHPLPRSSDFPLLQYDRKIPESKIIMPIFTEFCSISENGRTELVSHISTNSVVLADNLFALHNLLSSPCRAKLIYLDPPYNTGADFQSRQLEHAYNDEYSLSTYIEYMRRRIILMRELLADDGSIYLHIGHQMLAHMKIILDEVFGPENFRNLITRRKCSSKNFTKHQFTNLNDYILFYTKSSDYVWNRPGEKPSEEWIEKEYPKQDSRGRYKLVPVHAPGTRHGETGKPWRNMLPPPGKHWQYTPKKLDEFDKIGEIHWSRNGNPRRKVYLTSEKLVSYSDYWDCFRDAHHQSIEITGYPTEKNLDMLKMIVSASSNPGDIVIDPFCGSGTTLHAAADLDRDWIGIDQSFTAIKTSVKRLRYGTEPMGDFVGIIQKENSQLKSNNLDLFSTKKNPAQIVSAKPMHVDNKGFSVIVDKELLPIFSDEISEIALL